MMSKRRLNAMCTAAGLVAAGVSSTPAHAQDSNFIELYGFAMADGIYDTHRVDPAWEDAFRPSKIATGNTDFGSNGQSSVSVKQSRFGLQGSLPPVDGNPINFKFEIDLRDNEEDRRLQGAHISLGRSQSHFEIVDLRSQVGRRAFRSCEAGPKGPLERSETTLSA